MQVDRKLTIGGSEGYLRGPAPNREELIARRFGRPRTGYEVFVDGEWSQRTSPEQLKARFGIEVSRKDKGQQIGGQKESAGRAAWRYLVKKWNEGNLDVEYLPILLDDQLEQIEQIKRSDRDPTVKQRFIDARVGQGRWRREMLAKWGRRCCVTNTQVTEIVRASHIKSWKESTDAQRLDPSNGLPLVATLDALFDRGLIAFEKDGAVRLSPRLQSIDIKILRLEGLRMTCAPSLRDYLKTPRSADEVT